MAEAARENALEREETDPHVFPARVSLTGGFTISLFKKL